MTVEIGKRKGKGKGGKVPLMCSCFLRMTSCLSEKCDVIVWYVSMDYANILKNIYFKMVDLFLISRGLGDMKW